MPYYGRNEYSSDRYLKFLYDLYMMSGSQFSVINDIIDYAFSGEMDIVYRGIEGFISETDTEGKGKEPTYDEKKNFIYRLESYGLRWVDFLEMTRQLSHHYDISGNAWLYKRTESVAGVEKVYLEVIDSRNCKILATEPGEPKFAVISDQWQDLLCGLVSGKDFKYEIVGIYPNITENKTVYQIANHTDRKKLYGRPKSMGSVLSQLAEWQIADYLVKVNQSETVSKHLIAFQSPEINSMGSSDPEEMEDPYETEEDRLYAEVTGTKKITKPKLSEFKQMVVEIKELMTTEGGGVISPKGRTKSSSIGMFEYPFGTVPPTLLDLAVFRDTNWLKAQSDLVSAQIYQAHRWSKEITGFQQVKNSIGGTYLGDLFKMKYTTVVQPKQEFFSSFWQQVWSDILKENCIYAIKFSNMMENIIWNDRNDITTRRDTGFDQD